MVDLLQLWVEFNRPHVVDDEHHVSDVYQKEGEIPCEHVGGADHVPRPHGVYQEGYMEIGKCTCQQLINKKCFILLKWKKTLKHNNIA